MPQETIKKLADRGFGFIDTGGKDDLFFHANSLQGVRFDELREGQQVEFEETNGPKGPKAESVRLV